MPPVQGCIFVIDARREEGTRLCRILRPLGIPVERVKALPPGELGSEVVAIVCARAKVPEDVLAVRGNRPLLLVGTAPVAHLDSFFRSGLVEYVAEPLSPVVVRAKLAMLIELSRVRRRSRRNEGERATRLEQLLDLIPANVWIAANDGRPFYGNRAWFEYSGMASGLDFFNAVHPEDRARVGEALKSSIAGSDPLELQYRLRRQSDGEYRWHAARWVPEFDANASVVSWIAVAHDIDEQKRLAETIANTSRARDEFLATVSHELRTPLNAIYGWTRVLRGRRLEGARLERGLAIIERSAQAQMQLIEDLLDVSRVAAGRMKLEMSDVSPAQMIRDAAENMRPLATAKGVELEVACDDVPARIHGDPNRIQQVLWNILGNAIKFTPKGGTVHAALRILEHSAAFEIADTGAGIDPSFLPKIFEPFTQQDGSITRMQGGLGIGLAIVRRIVELHGGTVEARSDGIGRGSLFTVEIPAERIAAAHSEWEEPHGLSGTFEMLPSLAGVRVLVVDDDADARELLALSLSEFGAVVTQAASAPEALALFGAHKPDVLLSDIGLPGQDGFTLIRQIRALEAGRSATVAAIAVTGYAGEEDRRRALEAGFQLHITKPVDPAELINLVGSAAGRSPTWRELPNVQSE